MQHFTSPGFTPQWKINNFTLYRGSHKSMWLEAYLPFHLLLICSLENLLCLCIKTQPCLFKFYFVFPVIVLRNPGASLEAIGTRNSEKRVRVKYWQEARREVIHSFSVGGLSDRVLLGKADPHLSITGTTYIPVTTDRIR